MNHINWTITLGELITVAILGVTAWVIYKYTKYTYGLLEEARKQTELQIRPFLVFKWIEGKLYVKNIGRGVAMNVKIEPFEWRGQNSIEKIIYDRIDVLGPDLRRILDYNCYIDGKEVAADLMTFLDPNWQQEQDIELQVYFENMQHKRYHTKVSTGKSGISVKNVE